MQSQDTMGLPITEWCSIWRKEIEHVAQSVKLGMKHSVFASESDGARDDGEMKANIMLAYRHLEDAKMRLGKVVQAHDGGKSVYDK